MLLNLDHFPLMVTQIANNQGLIFLSGILSFLGGVAIVRVHNVWSGDWRILVTLLGWLAILGGLVRMWFPYRAAPIARRSPGMRCAHCRRICLFAVGALSPIRPMARTATIESGAGT